MTLKNRFEGKFFSAFVSPVIEDPLERSSCHGQFLGSWILTGTGEICRKPGRTMALASLGLKTLFPPETSDLVRADCEHAWRNPDEAFKDLSGSGYGSSHNPAPRTVGAGMATAMDVSLGRPERRQLSWLTQRCVTASLYRSQPPSHE